MAAAITRSALSLGGLQSSGRFPDSERVACFAPVPSGRKNLLKFYFVGRRSSFASAGKRDFVVSANSAGSRDEGKVAPVDVTTAPSGSRSK